MAKGVYYEFVADKDHRHAPHKVSIEVTIKGERKRAAKFYASKADADVALAIARKTVAEWKANAAKQVVLDASLPPLPPTPDGVELFDTVATEWLQLRIEPHQTAGTLAHYAWLVDSHLRPVLRAWPVTDAAMTRERIHNHVVPALAANGASYTTRRAAVTILSGFFEYARTRPHTKLTINPAWKLKVLKPIGEPKRITGPNPMTPKQAAAYLDWIYDNRRSWWEFFLFLHDTGVRVGEASALKFDNLSLTTRRAHICEAFSADLRAYEIEKGVDPKREAAHLVGEADTKTHDDRWVVLSPDLADALEDLRAAQRTEAMRRGRPVPAHVFTSTRGVPKRPDGYAHDVHRAACLALGLKGEQGRPFVIHELRDTYATTQIMAGTMIGRVSKQIGHADEATTRKFYHRWLDELDGDTLGDRIAVQGTRKGTRKP